MTVTCLILLTMASSALAKESNWEIITVEDGITVMQKEVAGRSLPVFKGEGDVQENLYEILGVLRDIDQGKEWMHSCVESKLLKALGDREFMVYNRTEAPWPVSDRDVVVRSTASYEKATKTVTVTMRSEKFEDMPPVDGVVRMPRLNGTFELAFVSETLTRVSYEIDADPGGMLPHWIVRIASRDIPYITLTNLRDRVKEMVAKGTYKQSVAHYRDMGENW